MPAIHLVIQSDETAIDLKKYIPAARTMQEKINALEQLLNALKAGHKKGLMHINVGCVMPSQTFTCGAVAATNTAVVNGTTFTAVASGATANQFNVGADAAESARNLAASINASTTAGIDGCVFAVANAAVVTVYAMNGGTHMNAVTTTATGNITAGGATMAGGAVGDEARMSFGSAPLF